MNNNKKQALILSIVAVVTLIALVVGATFAYFKAQGGTGSSTEVKVTTYTTDMLTFTTGNAISLYADQSSFGQEKGSLSGETFAKATLVANNKTNEATDNYYVYFNIENNTFKYTLGNDKPELILTVTGPDGEVTSLPGLVYKTVQDRENKSISGFDVTTTNGLITIANKKTITATPSKEEQYTLKLTFVNYEGDQTANATSTLSAKVMIQKEPIVTTLASYITNLYTGTQGANNIYYHDTSLTNGAGDNSYRFAGASDQVNNYVCFGSSEASCPEDNLYRIIGVFGDRVKLIKSDYATSTLLGTDGDYNKMYTATGLSSSNYKGNNLANVAVYYWNKSNQNTWSLSNLNKINLNKNFITNIGADWAAKIDTTTWKVGGNTRTNIETQSATTAYQNEIVNPITTLSEDNKTEYSAKIGLMYVSDYGFAAAPSAWTVNLNIYGNTKNFNWMYLGGYEWTISRKAESSKDAFRVYDAGGVDSISVAGIGLAVRPAFNLTSSVTYVSGDGTKNLPIRID